MSGWARAAIFATVACGHGGRATSTRTDRPIVRAADAGVGVAIDAAPAKALEDDLPRLAAREADLYDQWAKALADGHDDCAAAAARIDALADAFAPEIAASGKILRAGRERVLQLRAALEPFQDRMDAAAKQIANAPVMKKCSQDAAFARAFDRLGES